MTLLEILQDIRRVHVELQDKDARGHGNGICHNVFIRLPEDDASFARAFDEWETRSARWIESWPLYSGRRAFPVPGAREDLRAGALQKWDRSDCKLYRAALSFDFAPKWKGVTGYQRAQLLDHLIRCAESEGV